MPDMCPECTRLAIVLSHPTQYYAPWFRWMRANTSLKFRVFYLWDFGLKPTHDRQFNRTIHWDIDLLGGYESELVPNRSRDPGTHHFRGLQNPEITARLAAWRPTVVLVFGYNYASHVRVIAWARRRRIPLVFRGDSHFIGRGPPRGLRHFALKLLYRQFAALTFVGAANRDYFGALGVNAGRLFFTPHAVDKALFDSTQPAHQSAALALRSTLRLGPTTRVVLFAGKLVAAKQPRELLTAFLAIKAPDSAIVFVGDGEERFPMKEIAATAPEGSVHFLPFANQSEMPARYLLADIFALPSRGLYETWGLAVNESMEMGVPALVSDRVGCQRDLVTSGETGWVFAANQPDALRVELAAALADVQSRRDHYRAHVKERIARYSFRAASEGLLAAVNHPSQHTA